MATKAVKLPEELDATSLIAGPFAALAGSLVLVFLFGNVAKLIAIASTSAWANGKGEAGRAVQPLAAYAKKALEATMGPISSLKFGPSEVLLGAILIVLVGMWRTQARQVAATQRQAAVALRDPSPSRETARPFVPLGAIPSLKKE
jgi:hypothetical protein